MDVQGESMERLESYLYVNPHTEREIDEEDEDCEEADKEHRSLTYMETVTSRTVRYYGTSTLKKNPRMNRIRRMHTRWGPVTENETILKAMHHEVTNASSGNSVDVVKLEREAKQIDEELKKMMKMSEKAEVNLDKIEEHSEKRKKLRKTIQEARSLSLEEESKKSTSYKHGKEKGYTVIIQNLRSSHKNKKELYEYLLKFGDICRFSYIDNSKIDKRINPRKDIMVSYATEGGFRRASRGKH